MRSWLSTTFVFDFWYLATWGMLVANFHLQTAGFCLKLKVLTICCALTGPQDADLCNWTCMSPKMQKRNLYTHSLSLWARARRCLPDTLRLESARIRATPHTPRYLDKNIKRSVKEVYMNSNRLSFEDFWRSIARWVRFKP
jgi:hypothetical protein